MGYEIATLVSLARNDKKKDAPCNDKDCYFRLGAALQEAHSSDFIS
jgi:hypothetical protein